MPKGIYKRTSEVIEQRNATRRANGWFRNPKKAKINASSGQKNRIKKFGYINSPKVRQIISEKNKGEKNGRWKGEKAGYTSIHIWVIKHKGQPTKCEHCGKDNLIGRAINWANKDHKYKRDLNDWLRLCRFCHAKYDKNI